MLGRDFWRIWAAAVGNRFGDQVRVAGLALLAAQSTDSAVWLGVVIACNYLPWLLFGLVSGAAVDRLDKRRAFVVADLCRAALCGLLVVSVFAGTVHVLVLAAFAFVLTSLQTVSDSSFTAMLPRIVDRELLAEANSRLSAAQGVAGHFLGAPVGGALFVVAHAFPFLVNGLTLALATVLVLRVRVPDDTGGALRDLRVGALARDVADGLRWFRDNRAVAAYGYAVGVMNFASAGVQATLVLYCVHELGLPQGVYGLALAAWGGGAIVGNLLAPVALRRVDQVSLAMAAQSCQIVGYGLLAFGGGAPAMFVGLALNGFGAGNWNVTATAAIQAASPVDMLGRVGSVLRMVSFGTAPLGAVAGGVLAEVVGLRAPAAVGVVASVAAIGVLVALVVLPRRSTVEREEVRS